MSRDAIVVGINYYTDEKLPNLTAPASDAEAIASVLEQYGEFRVSRLPEAIKREDHSVYVGKKTEVKFTQLRDALVKLFLPSGKNIPDTALFYFSGHGIRENRGIQEGFLASSDVYPDIGFNGLSLKWLRQLLQESPIKQQIVWLDCCHSGELLNVDEANPGEVGKTRDRCFIAASREFEPAYESITEEYSVLTKVLLKGLDFNRAQQSSITNYGLIDFINQNFFESTQRPIYTNFGEPIELIRSQEASAAQSTQQAADAICPYKGLAYFDCNDEDPKYFYGRSQLTNQLLDKVRQSNFLALVGASGSGKSSVLRAGLLHQLTLGRAISGSEAWDIHIMMPGEHPLQNLALAFVDSDLSLPARAEQLGQAEKLINKGADGLRLLVQSSGSPRLILALDQFEESFTLCEDKSEREKFFECILGALEKTDNQLCLVIAMRADFFGKCFEDEYSGLAEQIQAHLIAVKPMNSEQLQQAIVEPAKKVNMKIEPELVQEMLTDVKNAPGSLPLLQYTLEQLWKQRKDNCLQLNTYASLGGVIGTLQKRATQVYEKFDSQQQATAKHIFLSLTQLGEGTEDTRRRVAKRDLVTAKQTLEMIDEVIEFLANERLVVTNELLAKDSGNSRVTVVDVAHEALIRHWGLLRQWLDESREALRKERKIESEAKYWLEKDKSKEILWEGGRLAEAEEILSEYAAIVPLSKLAQEFIEESKKKELRSYLQQPYIDNLDKAGCKLNAAANSFLTKPRLWHLLEDLREDPKVRLAASWVLKQWGEQVPMWFAETDGSGKIALVVIEEKLPPTVIEDLRNGISLELVAIPGGEFWMGAPEGEEGGNWWERPPHLVKVSPFLISKYPVTQSQWRAIATDNPVEIGLNPEPSYFKGDSRPVESISWYEAVEFCQRLSRKSGKEYRLPSEAEWEYACRAIQKPQSQLHLVLYPPYHFGEKIDPALANYVQTRRGETTPVGRFQVVNNFGLYDMHGQVWEWCSDDWHDDYEGAPTDGSAWRRRGGLWSWIKGTDNPVVVRGGSWDYNPPDCRSAYRGNLYRGSRNNNVGFRVMCVAPRTT
ncbi:MAG: SUMF1/EgtB/PvdO family nonheme iron enzyme [Prochloraceae cyanobacterium]|nr:SUMF1/EgtB/PvdO family nonheme iron enzyme [Prochloraceae cyanobacterium]